MRSYKKILTFIFAFAISFSVFCTRSFAVDHQYVSVSNIWSFAADHSWGVMPYLLGLICDEVCLETDDNKHYAMSYDYKTDDGIFYCVCQYCNEPFKAYVGTGDYGSGIGRGELLYEAYLEYLESSDAPPSISSSTHGDYYYYGENIYPVIPDYDDTAYQYALIYDVGNIDDVRFFASNVPWTYVYTGGRYVITNSSPCTIISHRYVNGSWSVVEVIQDDTKYGTQIGAGDLTELWCNVSIKNSSGTVKYTGTSSEPLSSSETYFYYGDYVFPEIPNWDQSIYPYAFLYDIGNIDDIRVFVSTKPFVYVYTNSKYCVANSASCTTVAYRYLNGVWSSNSPVSQSQYGFNVGVTDITKSWFNQDVLSTSGSVKYTGSDPVPITIDSGTNDRFGPYMEELDAWNQSNPYLDNPYTPNYYITPDGGDTLCSPAVFSESTKTFTEPVTGVQILCTDWMYHYDPDDIVSGTDGESHESLGNYVLFLDEDSYFFDSSPVDIIVIVYADDFLRISHYVEDSSVDIGYRLLGSVNYWYAVVAQTECGVGEHDMTWEVTQDPTCTSTGTEVGTCSICGEIRTYQLDQLDHIYKSSVTQQATCAGTGVMTYTCTVCGNEYTETIAATGVHSYTYETIREPTCGVSGERKYTCSVCGNSYAEDLPPTGDHDWLPSEVDATTYDLPEGTSCPDCSGTNFTYVLNGELYDCTCSDCAAEWSVRAVITYGRTTYTCSVCGASYVEQEGEEDGLFAAIANFLSDGITWVTDKFTELAESLSGIHTTFRAYLERIRNVGGDFPALIAAAVGVMPSDFMDVVWFGVICTVLLAVYLKFFR